MTGPSSAASMHDAAHTPLGTRTQLSYRAVSYHISRLLAHVHYAMCFTTHAFSFHVYARFFYNRLCDYRMSLNWPEVRVRVCLPSDELVTFALLYVCGSL